MNHAPRFCVGLQLLPQTYLTCFAGIAPIEFRQVKRHLMMGYPRYYRKRLNVRASRRQFMVRRFRVVSIASLDVGMIFLVEMRRRGDEVSLSGRTPRKAISLASAKILEPRTAVWRRGWDSNPRDPFGSNGFQDRRFQPLTHPSEIKFLKHCNLQAELVTVVPYFGAFSWALSPNCHQNRRVLLPPRACCRNLCGRSAS